MDALYAKQILQSLADGVNPATGEVLAREDSCNEPEVIRALHWVLQELEKAEIWWSPCQDHGLRKMREH